MRVVFKTPEISDDHRGEIDAVLQRIAEGPLPGQWRTRPDEIQIVAKLAGGRSGAEILEAVVIRGNQEAKKAIKLGPVHEIRGECPAFQEHRQKSDRFFRPIIAVMTCLVEVAS